MLCRIEALGGYTLDLPDGDYMVRKIASRRPAEERLLRAAAALAQRGLVVDAGAHAGNHSVYLAKAGCSVVAFEPNPAIRKYLQRNVEMNDLSEVVEVVPCGLWDRTSRGSVVAGPKDHTGMAKITEEATGDVDLIALDELGLSPDLVKVDVEGAEISALRGAMRTIRASKPAIFVEAHKDLSAVTDLLRPLGYHRFGGFWAQSPTYLFLARPGHLGRITPRLIAASPFAARVALSRVRQTQSA